MLKRRKARIEETWEDSALGNRGAVRSSEWVSSCVFPTDLTQHPWIPARWILLQLISAWTHHCYSDSPLVDLIWFLWYMTHFQAPGCFSSCSSTWFWTHPSLTPGLQASCSLVTQLQTHSYSGHSNAVLQNFLWWWTCSTPSLSSMVATSTCD